MKPETLGPIITSLNGILHDYVEFLMGDETPLDPELADAIIAQYVALKQLRDKLVDAATSPD